MPKLKPISYTVLVRKMKKAGYIPVRKGRHIIYFHPQKEITVPIPHKHPHDVSKGLLAKIVKEMKLAVEEFNRL